MSQEQPKLTVEQVQQIYDHESEMPGFSRDIERMMLAASWLEQRRVLEQLKVNATRKKFAVEINPSVFDEVLRVL